MNARNYNDDATLKALDKELAQQKKEKYKDVGSDAEEIMSESEGESDNSSKSKARMSGAQLSPFQLTLSLLIVQACITGTQRAGR